MDDAALARVQVTGRTLSLLGVVSLIWAISLAGFAADEVMAYLALHPRDLHGLIGVLGAPFVHGSFEHLMANTGALLILGALLVARGGAYFLRVSAAITILGGIAVWLLGRETPHVGASGLIFGIFGFLIARAIFERSLRPTLVALVVVLSYGTMIFGVFPQDDRVSWESHLFGLIAGGIVAYAANAIATRGEDVVDRLEITLEQACTGARCDVQAMAPSTTSVRTTRRRRLRVRIPPDIRDGQRIRLRGQGGECAGAGPPGDLLLDVHFAPHPVFGVDGRNVTSSLRVTPMDASTGARVKTPTPHGEKYLHVPAGSATGSRLRLRGCGLPGKSPGDQIVTLVVG